MGVLEVRDGMQRLANQRVPGGFKKVGLKEWVDDRVRGLIESKVGCICVYNNVDRSH